MSWDAFWGNDPAAMVSPAAAAALAEWWRVVLDAEPWRTGALFLEIACGATPVALHAKGRVEDNDRRYVAADLSVDAVAAVAKLGRPFRPVVADARRLPFRAESFDAVFSQFGVEYAGTRAIERAAALVAPGGMLAAVMHLRGGAIASECEAAVADFARFSATDVLGAARRALTASFAQPLAERFADPKREKNLSRALQAARAPLSRTDGAVRRLLVRYLDDLERLSAQRFSFDPEESLGWLDRVQADLAAYRRRLAAMVEAAVGEPHMQALTRSLLANGFTEALAEKLKLGGSTPAAWGLVAVRR